MLLKQGLNLHRAQFQEIDELAFHGLAEGGLQEFQQIGLLIFLELYLKGKISHIPCQAQPGQKTISGSTPVPSSHLK